MKIDVPNIPEEGSQIHFAEHPVILETTSLLLNGPIEGTLSLQRQGKIDVHIWGSLSARIVLSCGRCLNSFEHLIESDFYVDCTHEEKALPNGQERCLYGEELNLHFYQGETIEVNEIIENQIHLEIPMVPLCKEDCLGLCLTCGEDLNITSCNCIKTHS